MIQLYLLQVTLVSLQDMTQNASMKVMSLQEECAKAGAQASLVASVKKLTEQVSNTIYETIPKVSIGSLSLFVIFHSMRLITLQVNEVRATDINLTSKMKQLEDLYNALKNSTGTMSSSLSDMINRQRQTVEAKDNPPVRPPNGANGSETSTHPSNGIPV